MVLDVNSQHDIGTARAALEGREEIEAFRRDLAVDLKDEAYELIKTYDAVYKRKQPLLLSVRNTCQAFGFRLV
ncbi:hypothetical protein KM176_19530 [Pseudooceanicola sp. CBS1P-1]|uniref:Uncharacterized protein n=1 Tax=Pseudooceanicola albus TaxID=2692189 RepID=A0A6L7G6F2_9RHOB|nr:MULTISPECIES: hypothetical protein [Pseudooceanicola]MBT9386072.1 hypothetical protein [Pseudooceanicola endophyticus]MXN19509.1 hypothetical protein [Pseudooceanicola albus]